MTEPLRIGIVSRFHSRAAGLGTYGRQLLQAIGQLDTPHRFIVFARDKPRFDTGRLEWMVVPSNKGNANSDARSKLFLWDQFKVPTAIASAKLDMVHWLYQTGSVRRTVRPTIITVADAIPWQISDYSIDRRLRWYYRVDKFAIRRADHLVTISEHSKRTISNVLKIPTRDITATLLAGPTVGSSKSRKPIIRGDYILFVGGAEVRKNSGRLIAAFSQASLPKHMKLVITGVVMKSVINDDILGILSRQPSSVRERVVLPGTVSNEDLRSLFTHAKFFAFPSLAEGFGLPVLEAMAYGTPVLTSETSSLPEVAGSAAVLVNPESIIQISRGLERLADDASLRKRLAEAGKKQAASFTWKRTAQETVAVYERLAKANK